METDTQSELLNMNHDDTKDGQRSPTLLANKQFDEQQEIIQIEKLTLKSEDNNNQKAVNGNADTDYMSSDISTHTIAQVDEATLKTQDNNEQKATNGETSDDIPVELSNKAMIKLKEPSTDPMNNTDDQKSIHENTDNVVLEPSNKDIVDLVQLALEKMNNDNQKVTTANIDEMSGEIDNKSIIQTEELPLNELSANNNKKTNEGNIDEIPVKITKKLITQIGELLLETANDDNDKKILNSNIDEDTQVIPNQVLMQVDEIPSQTLNNNNDQKAINEKTNEFSVEIDNKIIAQVDQSSLDGLATNHDPKVNEEKIDEITVKLNNEVITQINEPPLEIVTNVNDQQPTNTNYDENQAEISNNSITQPGELLLETSTHTDDQQVIQANESSLETMNNDKTSDLKAINENIDEIPAETNNMSITQADEPFLHQTNNNDQKPANGNTDNASLEIINKSPIKADELLLELANNNDQRPISGNIDDMPVGVSNKNQFLNEFPDDNDPLKADNEASEEENLPLEKRVKSKIWKTRQLAYEELIKKFETANKGDKVFEEFACDLTKFISDTNPGAQEKALILMSNYLDKFQALGPIGPRETTKTLIDKVIAPGKPNAKKIAYKIQFFIFEHGDKNSIFEAIIDCINHKMQKTSVASIQILTELLKEYGPQKLDYLKPFFPHMEKMAASTVSSQRTEAINFYKQAFLFLGEALKPFLAKLKKQQVDELEKFYKENAQSLPKPSKPCDDDSSSNNSMDKPSFASQIDPYTIADPVEITFKFNEHWTEKVLAQPKWSDKKQMLEGLIAAASVPKLANSNYHHIHSMLKKLLNDSNVVVVTLAIKVYGVLSKALRKHFYTICKIIAMQILLKFREKKTQVIEETSKTLENFLYCLAPDDIIEDVKEALNDKTASVKQNTLLWLEKYFEKMSNTPEKCTNLFKNLLPLMKKLLEDNLVEVRDSAITTFAKLKSIMGDLIPKSAYNDIAPAKLTKINDICNKLPKRPNAIAKPAKVQANEKSNPEEENKLRAKSISQLAFIKADNQEKVNNKPSISGVGVGLGTEIVVKAKPAEQVVKANQKDEESLDIVCTLSAKDAEAKLKSIGLLNNIVNGLCNGEPSEIKKSLNSFSQWIIQNIDRLKDHLEHIFRFLKAKLNDWNEANIDIIRATLTMIVKILKPQKLTLTKESFHTIIPFLANNIDDSECYESSSSIIASYTEILSPKFIVNQLIRLDECSNHDYPKLTMGTHSLFIKLLEIISSKTFPFKETIEFAKPALSNPNVQIRSSATKLFVKIYEQIGQSIHTYLGDIDPRALKSLILEFVKIGTKNNKETEKDCSLRIDDDQADESPQPTESLSEPSQKIDISKDIEKILKKLTDNDWKIRKKALEACENILLTSNNRILLNGLNDFVAILKSRLQDPNKPVLKGFISFTGKFLCALGNDSKQHIKTLILPLLLNLCDKQSFIKTETIVTLDKLVDELGADVIINSVLPCLAQENSELRIEIFNWTLKSQDTVSQIDLKGNIPHITATFNEKVREIKNLGEKLLDKIVQTVGISAFQAIIKDLKPAVQKDLKPIIDKYIKESNNNDRENEHAKRSMKRSPSETLAKPLKAQKLLDPKQLQLDDFKLTSGHSKKLPSSTILDSKEANEYLGTIVQSQYIPMTTTTTATTLITTASIMNNTQSILYITGQKALRIEDTPIDASSPSSSSFTKLELNDEFVEKLKENLKKNVSSELYTKLFSFDTRKQTEAINLLRKAATSEISATIDNLDLIFKWVFLKLWDNANLNSVKEITEYILVLMNCLELNQYKILDLEMFILSSCLLRLFGRFPSEIQGSLHKIWQKLGSLYSIRKIIGLIIQNLNNNESKVQVDMLDTITELIQLNGKDSITAGDIKSCSKYLVSSDPSIQKAAHNLFAELALLHGECLLKQFEGKQALYYQNMFFSSKKIPNDVTNLDSKAPVLSVANQESCVFNSENALKKLLQHQASLPISKQSEVIQSGIGSLNLSQEEQGKSRMVKLDEENFQKCLQMLAMGNICNKLDALLYIYDILTLENEANINFLKIKGNQLIQALCIGIKMVFEKSRNETPAKLIFYFLNIIHKLCSMKPFMKSISEQSLFALSNEILTRLILEDEGKQDKTDKETTTKSLNSSILRILENSIPTDMFSVLFDLLISHRVNESQSKIMDLSIKCLLKLTKSLHQHAHELKPSVLLLKAHLYIIGSKLDPASFGDDMGIKTIKTMLVELFKLYQHQLWDHYHLAMQNQPIADIYLRKWISAINRPPLGAASIDHQQQQHQNQYQQLQPPKIPLKTRIQPNIPDEPGQDSMNENLKIRFYIEALKTDPNDLDTKLNKLYDEIIKHPGINLGPYFKDSPKGFIDHVTNSLERIKYQRNHHLITNEKPFRNASNESRYQHRLLDGYNAQSMKNLNANIENQIVAQTDTNQMKNPKNLNLTTFEEYHTKVNSLKVRYGNMLRNTNNNKNPNQQLPNNQFSSQGTSPISFGTPINQQFDNAAKPKANPSIQNSSNQMQTQLKTFVYPAPSNTSSTPGGPGINMEQYGKTTENILQKLNEMKAKMHSITNSNKLG